MIEAKLRGTYQTLCIKPLLPLAKRASPQTITVLALVTGLLIPVVCFFGSVYWALFFLMVSGYLDTLDGSVARENEKTSSFGAALDICSDRLVEWSVILGLYLLAPETRAFSCLLMLGSILFCVSTFLVVGIFTTNDTEKSFHYSPGIMERAEAFIFFACMLLFPKAFSILSSLFTFLLFLTGFIRLGQWSLSAQFHKSEG